MNKAGFENSRTDPFLFYCQSNKNCLYVALYVDDGLVVGSNKTDIEEFMEMLKFHTTRGSLNNFLHMKIQQNEEGSIAINQEDCTMEILKRFGMAEANGVSTPIGCEESDVKEKFTAEVPYREAMYLSTVSHPDIAFAVKKAARAMEDPTVQDWNRVKRIFRYLKNMMSCGIIYKNNTVCLKLYSDAYYAGDKDTRRSTTGVVATLSHGAVS
ncbi:uncharacterized protein LOC126234992 [Schistocerca nitens]|uniref:uncharacterized protein LOC126234992 n=1 Tax=Schistocerca nitens TaxID=7011 RepID=UPI00211946AE|nr:uncharacterized protein LOC126234992 [Schistocerca nitens]